MNKFPEKIQEAVDLLETSEKINSHPKKIDLFKEAFEILSESSSKHPEFEEKIKNIKKSYTRSLLQKLKDTMPNLNLWPAIGYILIFLSNAKNETKLVIHEDDSLKNYLFEFISLWSDKAQGELRAIISSELGIKS